MNAFGTPESIGESNKKLILNRLRTQGAMSRADLSRAIGMSFTAISSNVRNLLDRNYIRSLGAGANSVGRKSTLLSFNAERGYVIGVDVGRTTIRCMAADLLGRAVGEESLAHNPSADGGTMIDRLVAAVDGAVARTKVRKSRVLCVCIGVPGVPRDNCVYLAPYFTDFSLTALRARLARKYAAEVIVENGVNLGAIGEHLSRTGSRYDDLAYFSYGIGLGSALILGGALHPGFRNAAGEIGFMQLDPAALPRRFNEIGPLENALSPGRPAGRRRGRGSARDVQALLDAYRAGDGRARGLLETVSRDFAMAMINVCAVVNPQAVIVSGGIGKALGEEFLPAWNAHLARGLPFPPEVMLSDLDGRETMLGAVGTALNRVEAMPIDSR
ncbi:MAG: ROK family transcriptional regulator [Planctomycetota bacterium]|jgi:predicted NBD/HSP70 family sugar kinase|nr:ROK family transcriptional regulator [Planctomycetota bacterium]